MQKDKYKIKIGAFTTVRGELIVYPHNGEISIGDYCYIGVGTRIWSAYNICIGNNILIAYNVDIHHSLNEKK